MLLRETYAVCAAHLVSELSGRDAVLHGHVWTVRITLAVEIPEGRGCAFDHARFNDIAKTVLGPLDHGVLNNIAGLESGTNEALARWVGLRVLAYIRRTEDLAAVCDVHEILIGQFGSDEHLRLAQHEVVWVPTSQDRDTAQGLA